MVMFYLQYACIPSPTSDNYDEIGGAFISCWIKAVSMEAARKMAEVAINENNWIVQKLEESCPIKKEDYGVDDESLEYYKQAEIDGEVYVYDTWPNKPQEEEQVH
jgi:hypothetical protein